MRQQDTVIVYSLELCILYHEIYLGENWKQEFSWVEIKLEQKKKILCQVLIVSLIQSFS